MNEPTNEIVVLTPGRVSKLVNLRRGLVMLPLLLTAAACAPMAATMPMTTMQRADRLAPGAQAISAGAGAGVGGVGWAVGAVGGAAQARFAQSADSEVSVAGQAVAYNCDGCADKVKGRHLSFGGRLGYRHQLGDQAAWLAGVGYAGGAGGDAVSTDVGMVRNLGRYVYLSARIGVSDPVTQVNAYDDKDGQRQTTPVTTYEMGAAGIRLGHDSALLAEVGLGLIDAGSHHGAAAYALVGVDVLRLAP